MARQRTWTVLGALCVVLLAAEGARAISSPSGIDPRLHLEYEIGRTRHGKPELQGYIYNEFGRAAINVRLLAETLDDSGAVIGRAYGFVFGSVPGFNRAPFSVSISTAGASYRLTVTQVEWRAGGGGS